MKILLTGGVGFLGTNIATLALQRGHKVVAFDNLIRPGVETNILKHNDYEIVRGDVRNPEDFLRIPDDVDGICHLAANPGVPWSFAYPKYDYNVNNGGTFNVLEYAREHGNLPVIYASTNKCYSEIVNTIPVEEKRTRYVYSEEKYKKGINEKFPIDGYGDWGHSPYGVSKLSGDLMCQEWFHAFGVPTVVNRMSCLYGKYQFGVTDQGWMAWFVIAKIMGIPLTFFGDGKQVRDALYGTDIARLYIMELEHIKKFKGKVFNVGGGMNNTVSLLEAIELIDLIDRGRHTPFRIKYGDWRMSDHKCYISDISKIEKYWEPEVNVGLGLRKTYDWVLSNKELIKRYL